MSNLLIRIELDNDAFNGADCGNEISRILRELAGRMEWSTATGLADQTFTPRDFNGNVVGTVDFEIDDEDPDSDDAKRQQALRDAAWKYVSKQLSPDERRRALHALDSVVFPVTTNTELTGQLVELMLERDIATEDVDFLIGRA